MPQPLSLNNLKLDTILKLFFAAPGLDCAAFPPLALVGFPVCRRVSYLNTSLLGLITSRNPASTQSPAGNRKLHTPKFLVPPPRREAAPNSWQPKSTSSWEPPVIIQSDLPYKKPIARRARDMPIKPCRTLSRLHQRSAAKHIQCERGIVFPFQLSASHTPLTPF